MVNWSIAELQSRDWNTPELQAQIQAVAARYNQEYRGEAFSVPDEVAALPLYPEFAAGSLTSRITSPFWDLARCGPGDVRSDHRPRPAAQFKTV